MRYYALYILIISVLFGCQDQTDNSSVYLGGEIINPKSDVVLLMKNEQVIDSIPLLEDHTFGAEISGISPGLYYFKHGYEFQYLYLEPQDSIRLRLNTWDFDETLVFEGRGALKNELLIDLFLENEKIFESFYSNFSLPETEFLKKIDEIQLRHSELLTSFVNDNNAISEDYIHLAKATIDFPLFHLKEIYPYYHKKMSKIDDEAELSNTYYEYRNNINLNDVSLSEHYSYQNYITVYLYNLAYHNNNGTFSDKTFQKMLLQLIVEKIELPILKNRLLTREINNLFFNHYTYLDKDNLDLFYDNCTDTTSVNTLKQLLIDRDKLPVDGDFPDFKVTTRSKEVSSINSIIKNKNAVIYFWTEKNASIEYLNKRIGFLCEKYPDIIFIGINMDKLADKCFIKDLKHQYYLTPNSKGHQIASNKYTRSILVNSKGKVINSFTLLTNSNIEKQLKDL